MITPKHLMPIPNSSFSTLSDIMTKTLHHVYVNRRSQQECEKALAEHFEKITQETEEQNLAFPQASFISVV
jgi:hypothetical protein